jgi:hypothetical protein
MPSDSDHLLIIKEIFRVSKVLRNTLVHNPSLFTFKDDSLAISYQFKNAEFSIVISHGKLNFLYSLIVMLVTESIRNEYFYAVVRFIYMDVFNSIRNFSDDFNFPLKKDLSGLMLKSVMRIRLKNTKYKIIQGCVKIIPPQEVIRDLESYQGLDFLIHIDDETCLIPLESLDNELSLLASDIAKWKEV